MNSNTTVGFENWKKCSKKILEKFLSILLKITKILFFISFSVTFVFLGIIDLENKGHFSTKIPIIAINLNQFFFYQFFRKSFKIATKCFFWNFCPIFFHSDAPGHKWTKILMIFMFHFWVTKNKQTSECIYYKHYLKAIEKSFQTHPNWFPRLNFFLKYETLKYG